MTTTIQFKRLAKESGIYEYERYLNATETLTWEEVAVMWIQNGTDPDKV